MKFSSVLLGFVIGFATYFVMLQCIAPSENCQFKQICDKNIQIRSMEGKIKRLERDLESLARLNEGYNVTINKLIRGN